MVQNGRDRQGWYSSIFLLQSGSFYQTLSIIHIVYDFSPAALLLRYRFMDTALKCIWGIVYHKLKGYSCLNLKDEQETNVNGPHPTFPIMQPRSFFVWICLTAKCPHLLNRIVCNSLLYIYGVPTHVELTLAVLIVQNRWGHGDLGPELTKLIEMQAKPMKIRPNLWNARMIPSPYYLNHWFPAQELNPS